MIERNRINFRFRPSSLAILLLLVVGGCDYPGDSPSDKALAKQLVDTWIAEWSEPYGSYSEKTCHRDGTADGFILSKSDTGQIERTNFKSAWRVKNGYVVGKVLESDDAHGYLKAGDQFADKIVSVTKTEFIFDSEYGTHEIRKRKPKRFLFF